MKLGYGLVVQNNGGYVSKVVCCCQSCKVQAPTRHGLPCSKATLRHMMHTMSTCF